MGVDWFTHMFTLGRRSGGRDGEKKGWREEGRDEGIIKSSASVDSNSSMEC